MHYSFARVHRTLRVTPAIEAGLATHVWSLERNRPPAGPAVRVESAAMKPSAVVDTRVVLLVACMAAACGEHSAPVQPSTTLQTGTYRLTLTMSVSGDPICTGAGCAVNPCDSTGGVVASSLPIDVRAERTGDEIAIHPVEPSATFRMNLRLSGIALSGTASGQVRSGGVVVATDGGRPQSAAVVTGIAAPGGPRFAAGTLEGVIAFDGAGCLNNAHRWDLDQFPF
jgi:hypothetical protein